jgi:hypothetical protein
MTRPEQGVRDTLLGESLEHDGRAGERHEGPEPHRLFPADAEDEPAYPVAEEHRQRHLDGCAYERDAPYRGKLFDGEVQPDGEEQERHPDLCQKLDVVDVSDRRSSGVGTDQDAGQDVAQDQGQPQPPGDETTQKGRHQDQREIACNAHATILLVQSSGDVSKDHSRTARSPKRWSYPNRGLCWRGTW